MFRSLSLAAAVLLAACSPTFDPASRVQGLRLLAVRAEPPEIAPASYGVAPDSAALGALVAHPAFVADPSRRATVLHLACTPVAGDPASSPCTQIENLGDPLALVASADVAAACASPGVGAAGAVSLAGVESCGLGGCGPVSVRRDPADPASVVDLPAPAYRLPPGFDLAALPPGSPSRVLGAEVLDVALAVDVTPAELGPDDAEPDGCAVLAAFVGRFRGVWPVREHVVSLKRIRVRGPDAPGAPNRNPAVSGIALGGVALPAAGSGAAPVAAGAQADLRPVFPGDPAALRETYVECDAAGVAVVTATEEWAYSWFATAGEIDELHTRDAGDPGRFTAPASGRAVVYAVARDLRGGVAWTTGAAEVAP